MAGPMSPITSDPRDVAIWFVLEEEGGFQANPKDPGNWTKRNFQGELKGTNFGISALAYPKLDIRGLTKGDAMAIYKQNYWGAARCGDMPPALGVALFDTTVNCGMQTAIMMLQRALGVSQDGKVGPITLKAAMSVGGDRIPGFLALRMAHYHRLCAKNPGMETFFLGWAKRTMRLMDLCARLPR